MFLNCLESEFHNNVLSHLEVLNKATEGTVCPEDRFQLDDVIEMAISIGQGSQTAYRSVTSHMAPASQLSRANNTDLHQQT